MVIFIPVTFLCVIPNTVRLIKIVIVMVIVVLCPRKHFGFFIFEFEWVNLKKLDMQKIIVNKTDIS